MSSEAGSKMAPAGSLYGFLAVEEHGDWLRCRRQLGTRWRV